MTYIKIRYKYGSEEKIQAALNEITSDKFAKNLFEQICTFGYIKTVKLMLQDPKFDNAIKVSIKNAIKGALSSDFNKITELLIKDPRLTDKSYNQNFLISAAVEIENLNLLKFLMNDPTTDPSDDNNYALLYAAEYDFEDIIKQLLTDKRVDPSVDDNTPLKYAAITNENYELTKLYLKDTRVLKKLTADLSTYKLVNKALKELYNVSNNTIEQLSNLF